MNIHFSKIAGKKLALASIAVTVIITGCTAPKSITDSGKVTPKHQIKVGVSYAANVPTQTIKNAVELVNSGIDAAKIMDANYDEGKNTEEAAYALSDSPEFKNKEGLYSKYLIGYSVDPLSYGLNYYARYGLAERFDIGYQYSGGTNAIDVKYQFMGPTGVIGSHSDKKLYGSVGLQYSSRKYDLPFKLGWMQDYVDYKFKRKDIFIPVIFSRSFGSEEKIGHISWGVAYNGTFLEYGFKNKAYEDPNINLKYTDVNVKKYFSSYGTFMNVKAGYKYVYFLASFAVYYTNYGTYTLLDGSKANLEGFTFVPSIGLQCMIPPLTKRKKRA